MQSLTYKVEDGFATIAASGSYSQAFNCLVGVENEDKHLPCIVSNVTSVAKFNPYFDQYTINCDITIKQRLAKNNTNLDELDENKEEMYNKIATSGSMVDNYTTGLGIKDFDVNGQSTSITGNVLAHTISVTVLAHSTE